MADKIHPSDQEVPGRHGAYYSQAQKQQAFRTSVNNNKRGQRALPTPATYRAAGRRYTSPFCCCCLARICSLLVTIIITLAIVCALIYFLLRPKVPSYNIIDMHVSQLNVSSNPPELSYDITFTLQAFNPNKRIGIYYDQVSIFLFYEATQVGMASLPPFYQGYRNTTLLNSDLKGQGVGLQESTASGLQAAIAKQSIPFQVDVRVRARVKISIFKSPHFKVKDKCNVAISPPSASGGARLLSQSCKVDWGF